MMIDISHVHQQFGAVTALDDLSLQVARGQVVALVGPSGAGKTTLLRLMTSYLFPSLGTVRIGGVDTKEDSLRVRKMIGYLPERDAVYPDMRVMEYLLFRSRLKGLTGRARHKKLRELVQRCGLIGLERALLGSLSKGETRRVLLADSLAGNPALLLLDEPTLGLDPLSAERMQLLIASPKDEGTVVFSTHDWREAETLASHVAVLHNGRLVAFDTPARLVADGGAADLRSAVMKLTGDKGAT
jgi:ABC-2 type transport system ATP-binding protein